MRLLGPADQQRALHPEAITASKFFRSLDLVVDLPFLIQHLQLPFSVAVNTAREQTASTRARQYRCTTADLSDERRCEVNSYVRFLRIA